MAKKILIVFLFIVLFSAFVGIGYTYIMQNNDMSLCDEQASETETPENATQAEQSPVAQPSETGTGMSRAESILASMSLDEKIYQMFFVTPESITNVSLATAAGETTKNALAKYPVGGIIYFAKNLVNRQQTAEMIANSQSFSKIPLFIGVDEEGGRVARLGSNPDMGTSQLPPMQEIGESGDSKEAYEAGRILGSDLCELGFNVDFAPDADVLVDKKNTEIGDRSFGSDPELVSDMVSAVVKGLQEFDVSAVLKHFPGHGSTTANSHTGYSESTRTAEELRACEFLPFKAGIDADADFVLISHMTLVNAVDEKVPSTLSSEVISGYLFDELGFEGIAVTDSFSMGAITENYSVEEATVKAISAGADMILMTPNIDSAFTAVKDAVLNGEISESRIDKSVKKILETKEKRNLLN